MGLKSLTGDGINASEDPFGEDRSEVAMKKLLEMWRKKGARSVRARSGEQQNSLMKLQLTKMGKMNQKVISASLGK